MAFLEVSFKSDVLDLESHMHVLLPEKRVDLPQIKLSGADGKCPVLFLLHGLSDGCSAWMRYTAIERYIRQYEMAVVMPEVHRSFYSDMRHGGKYWTFIAQELMQKCYEFFPQISQKREDHYAAGLSMGGYGAMKLALRAPDAFCFAGALSGALDIPGEMETQRVDDPTMMDVFGTAEDARDSDDDLFGLATRLKASGKPLPKLFMWCGTEDFLYEFNTRMRDHLQRLGYDLNYTESPGCHLWNYWDREIQNVLVEIMAMRGVQYEKC